MMAAALAADWRELPRSLPVFVQILCRTTSGPDLLPR